MSQGIQIGYHHIQNVDMHITPAAPTHLLSQDFAKSSCTGSGVDTHNTTIKQSLTSFAAAISAKKKREKQSKKKDRSSYQIRFCSLIDSLSSSIFTNWFLKFLKKKSPSTMPTSVSKAGGPSEDTTVFVSGSSFCMVPSLYQKVEKLRWQKKRGFPHLNANADVFELLLRFLMVKKLPETTSMTARQAAELLKMIEPLGNEVESLKEHVQMFLEAEHEMKRSSSAFQFLRRLSSLTTSSKTVDEEDSIDLFETTTCGTSSTTRSNITKPSITLVSAVPKKEKPDNDKNLIDFFGVTNAGTNIMASSPEHALDNDMLPHLQVADSTDCSSSEASSPTAARQEERKVSFSMDGSTTTSVVISSNHSYSTGSSSSVSRNKPVATTTPYYFDSGDDEATMMNPSNSFESTHSSSHESSSSSSSFRGVVPTKQTFRNVFQKLKGGKNNNNIDVPRTHAEWCASEYVL